MLHIFLLLYHISYIILEVYNAKEIKLVPILNYFKHYLINFKHIDFYINSKLVEKYWKKEN